MCGQLTVYNTYATLSCTNPLFLGFSCYQNVNKEIIFYYILEHISVRFITPQNFDSGVFFYFFIYICGTVGISVLVCTMVPVLTWLVLEKNGTVVERIKGVVS